MDMREWLGRFGADHLADLFVENAIDFDVLGRLTDADLREIGVRRLGDRKRVLEAAAAWGAAAEAAPAADPARERYGENERRHVTVMFVDLVGSTVLAGRLDPEDLGKVLQHFREVCIGAIEAHEGCVTSYYGDGVLAVFGFPVANEQSAAQAIDAGLQVISALAAANPALAGLVPGGISVRVAVASGLVVVGRLGSKREEPEYSIVGETPNLAARLQDFAEPNTVVASDATRRLVAGRFDLEDGGLHGIRGFAAPVQVWRVRGARAERSRFDARPAGPGVALVGREPEIATLAGLWGEAAAGRGSVVVLSGEAGMGKSRLCRALRDRLGDGGHDYVALQCSEFHANSSLYPLIGYLRSAAGLRPEDDANACLDKVEALVGALDAGGPVLTQLLAQLLSVPDQRFPPLEISPERQRSELLSGIWRLISAGASRRPLLLVVEDAHWIDPTTRDLLDLAAADVAGRPILVIATQRPENALALPDAAHIVTLTLNRLTAADTLALVGGLAPHSGLPPSALDDILLKTDGVPLFIEEWTRMLLDRVQEAGGAAGARSDKERSEEIPSTLHDLLLARLDRLGEAKRVSQDAACLGRRFSGSQLARISQAGAQALVRDMSALARAGIIHPVEELEDVYEFRHALIQDAAYLSLLQSTRSRLHDRIAQAFEAEWALTEPESLARHFGLAQRHEKEIEYLQAAAGRRMGSSAFVEALSYYREAIDRLAQLPVATARQLELELQIQIAVPLTLTQGWAAAGVGAAYTRAQELCGLAPQSQLVFPARSGVFTYFMVSGLHRMARTTAMQDLDLASRTGDPATILEFELNAGVVNYYTGNAAAALAHLERSIALYDFEKHRGNVELYGKCPATVALAHASNACAALGRPADAFDYNLRSQDIADAGGHAFSQVWARSNHAINWILYEDAPRAAALASGIVAEAELKGFAPWLSQGNVWLGWARSQTGELGVGVELMRDGMALWERTGSELMRPFYHVLLAQGLGRARRYEEALRTLDAGFAVMARTGEDWSRPLAEITAAELEFAAGVATAHAAETRLRMVSRAAQTAGEWLWALKAERARLALPLEDARAEAEIALRDILRRFDDAGAYPAVQAAVAALSGQRASA